MVRYLEQTEGQFERRTGAIAIGSERVLRFERFQEDFDLACNGVGIPNQPLPHRNRPFEVTMRNTLSWWIW
jgi:hypothetical protein